MSKAALCMYIQVFSKYEFFVSLEEMPQSVVTGSRLAGIVLSCFSKHSGHAISHSHQECVSSGLSQWLSVFGLIKSFAFSSSCRLVVKSPCGLPEAEDTPFCVQFSSFASSTGQHLFAHFTDNCSSYACLGNCGFAVLTYPRITFAGILGYSK